VGKNDDEKEPERIKCPKGGDLNNKNNCGTCGNKCTSSQICAAGAGTCITKPQRGHPKDPKVDEPKPIKCAKGGPLNNNKNCGTCGNRCEKGSTCDKLSGKCVNKNEGSSTPKQHKPIKCPKGGVLNNSNNCGFCGNKCDEDFKCLNGQCIKAAEENDNSSDAPANGFAAIQTAEVEAPKEDPAASDVEAPQEKPEAPEVDPPKEDSEPAKVDESEFSEPKLDDTPEVDEAEAPVKVEEFKAPDDAPAETHSS